MLPDELDLVVRRHEATRLVFAVWLKFYTRSGRFPRGSGELHDDAVGFVARQLKVSAGDLGLAEWSGRTAERHRAAIRDMQREIHDGLNVAEGWNGGNQVLFYGKGGDIATNRRDEQELSVACLHVLQAAVAYVNTLLVQDVLAQLAWADALTPEDRRGLTPLFWAHVASYGEVKLNMAKRLELRGEVTAGG